MLDKRIEREKHKLYKMHEKIDVKERHPVLRSLEGWYTTDSSIESLPPVYAPLVRLFRESKSTMKFTRWLERKNFLDHSGISELGKLLASTTISFKISCRHADLLRLAETNHYFSCYQNWNGSQQLRYLADPDMAVIYVPDKAGKYMWRALVRLMLDPSDESKYVFAIYRAYGNSNAIAIHDRLNEILPLYHQTTHLDRRYKRQFDKDHVICELKSASVHTNRIVGMNVWSDHWCVLMGDNRLHMMCYPHGAEKSCEHYVLQTM